MKMEVEYYEAIEKIESFVDEGSFIEFNRGIKAYDFLGFAQYGDKLNKAYEESDSEGVITGEAKISSKRCVVIVSNPRFLLGTMGVACGEKIARAFDIAFNNELPVVSVSSSGGVRLQEGTIGLMQMIKVLESVENHNRKDLLFISVISNPTLGGVAASYVSMGDVIIIEKDATFGFAGRKVIRQTIGEKFDSNFQSAESALENGQVDMMIDHTQLRDILVELVEFHVGV